MAESFEFDSLCRICVSGGSGDEGSVAIYSEEGQSDGLHDKIVRFLAIEISQDDSLPKVVCNGCKTKLDSIERFRVMALKSQTTLEELRTTPNDLAAQGVARTSKELREMADTFWWMNEEQDSASADAPFGSTNNHTNGDSDPSKSLLHSILTNGQTVSPSDVTELEVTVDPMLFFEEDDEEEEEEIGGEGEESLLSPSFSPHPPEDPAVPSGMEAVQIVAEPKPYQCNLCPRGFNSDLSLKSHLWNHIPSRKVLATSDLNRHEKEKVYTIRMLNTQCLCQECGRVYPSKSTLRAHQITHSNLRPYKCSLCDKTFKRNQDLKFHTNQHTGERPYRCPYCPKAFASSGNCFSHRKRMHPKQLAGDKKRSRPQRTSDRSRTGT